MVSEGITIKMKKINQCKPDEEINNYFIEEDRKLCESYGFKHTEMQVILGYCNDRQKLLEKCGDRMRKLKEMRK